MSMADAQLLRDALRRIEALEQLIKGDPLVERLQRLEMRVGSLQSQINLLRNKAPVEPPRVLPDAPANSHADAPSG